MLTCSFKQIPFKKKKKKKAEHHYRVCREQTTGAHDILVGQQRWNTLGQVWRSFALREEEGGRPEFSRRTQLTVKTHTQVCHRHLNSSGPVE